MAENQIIGYKKIFGFVLPDWVDESLVRLIVAFLITSALMLFLLIFVIWPKMETVSDLKLTLKRNSEALDLLRKSKIGYDELNNQITEANQKIILSAIPQTYSPENAIFLLRKLANEVPELSIVSYKLPSGVLFETVDGAQTKKETRSEIMVDFVSYPVRLTVNGPVSSLLMFINKIETSLPFGVVSDVVMQEISKLVRPEGSKSVQIEIEVKYFQAIMNRIDIAKIDPLSEADLALAEKLVKFTRVPVTSVGTITGVVGPGTTPENLFGF